MGQLAQARADGGWFRPADVAELLETLRVPGGNVSRSLGLLKQQRLVLRSTQGWALTARGEARALAVMGELDAPKLEPEIEAETDGTVMGDAVHTTLPATFAPIRWQAGIAQLLQEFPFDTNVFVMTRFPRKDEPTDPLHDVIDVLRDVVARHGLTAQVASDRILDEDLLGNIAAHMWACRYGIGIFEDRAGKGLNYNVLLEIGAMTMAGRRCALLKDTTAPDMPTDLVGRIYKSVDLGDLDGVATTTQDWVKADLALGM